MSTERRFARVKNGTSVQNTFDVMQREKPRSLFPPFHPLKAFTIVLRNQHMNQSLTVTAD